MVFLTGCGTLERELRGATRTKTQAGLIGQALALTALPPAPLPDLPADCRVRERAGVKPSDRADAAILKYDAAVSRGNARIGRCAGFYDGVKASRTGAP